mgnify:CR=1 FL=1
MSLINHWPDNLFEGQAIHFSANNTPVNVNKKIEEIVNDWEASRDMCRFQYFTYLKLDVKANELNNRFVETGKSAYFWGFREWFWFLKLIER